MLNFVDYYIRYTERVSSINEAVRKEPSLLVKQMEQQYRKRINEIADFFYMSGSKGNKLLLLSGPSSSGKTTTAKMLVERLEWQGIKAKRISLDEFFLGREKTPLLPDGTPDFESVNALNIPQMQECLLSLINNGKCYMPSFDFVKQMPRDELTHISLDKNDVVIVEGIHALNPVVTDCLPDESMLKVYISVKQGIYEDDKVVMEARDVRLCRRLVRDFMSRGASPEYTFASWQKVLDGEEKYIIPFKRRANITINSIHIYEPCVLRVLAMPLLERVQHTSEYYLRSLDLKEQLGQFEPIDISLVPANSLVREFIGNGIYE